LAERPRLSMLAAVCTICVPGGAAEPDWSHGAIRQGGDSHGPVAADILDDPIHLRRDFCTLPALGMAGLCLGKRPAILGAREQAA
jgi:hypothetical protein